MTTRKQLEDDLNRAKAAYEKASANLDATSTRMSALAARNKAADVLASHSAGATTPEIERRKLGADRRRAVSDWSKAVEDRRKALFDRRNPGADLAQAELDLQKADEDLRRATEVLEQLERELGPH
jgi:hypothetical protein